MQSRFVMVGDIRTHYLEAGQGDNNIIMLHGAEYGGCANTSWEYNVDELGKNFHVYALDMVGFGDTDKLFSFDNMGALRINHIRKFMDTLCIDSAHFIGNSMGGGLILTVACVEKPAWNIDKIITISGGGPNNPEAHHVLNNYDGTMEYMKKIHELLFYDPKWHADEYVEKRYLESIKPGAWEALSAPRFRSPVAEKKERGLPEYNEAYRNIQQPVLVCAGDKDTLKFPEYAEKVSALLPNSRVEVFKDCCHCAQIERADSFNRIATEFLLNA